MRASNSGDRYSAMRQLLISFLSALTVLVAACVTPGSSTPGPAAAARPAFGAVDSKRLIAADTEGGQSLSHGRTYNEQRFSPLKQINTENVGQLGLAWFADFDTRRGQESTPIVVDGAIYVTTAWSKLRAFKANTG